MGREQFSLLCLKDEKKKKKSDVHHQAKVNPVPRGTALSSCEKTNLKYLLAWMATDGYMINGFLKLWNSLKRIKILNMSHLIIFMCLQQEECNFLRSMDHKPPNAEGALVRYASTSFLNTITMWSLYAYDHHHKHSNNTSSSEQHCNTSS